MRMSNTASSSVKQFTVNAETLEQLPPLYREVANILIERGEWKLNTLEEGVNDDTRF